MGTPHEAALGLGQAHDLQLDAVFGRGGLGPRAGVALIDVGEGHALARGDLHGRGNAPDLGVRSSAVAGVTCKASRCPSVSTARCTFELLRRLAPA